MGKRANIIRLFMDSVLRQGLNNPIFLFQDLLVSQPILSVIVQNTFLYQIYVGKIQ